VSTPVVSRVDGRQDWLTLDEDAIAFNQPGEGNAAEPGAASGREAGQEALRRRVDRLEKELQAERAQDKPLSEAPVETPVPQATEQQGFHWRSHLCGGGSALALLLSSPLGPEGA
jgi:hypothetical protein